MTRRPWFVLVVALHGCTQSAAGYDDEPGWVELAGRIGFTLVLPQQQGANNANSCFNWFETGDTSRGAGEALSIKQMVDRAVAGADAGRVYVTGLSAGGAMAAVMLAAYPDVFAAGAVVAGLPYRCATTLVHALGCMSPGVDLGPQQWSDRVRAASAHTGPRPPVSLWHGTADTTVAYRNLAEQVEQWTNVHGADQTADVSDTVGGYPHQVYRGGGGRDVVETFAITGMSHGQPVDPGSGEQQCGVPAPYILDVGICAAYRIARFWGLAGGVAPGPTPFAGVEAHDGYVKAASDGAGAAVGTLTNLAVGRGADGRHSRAVLSFDTSGLPDDATIDRVWLEVGHASGAADPWAGGNRLLVDVRTGCFAACTTEASDWSAAPSAAGVAAIPVFASGAQASTDFSGAGLAAISRGGITQLKLRFEQAPAATAYRFVRSGPATTLRVLVS